MVHNVVERVHKVFSGQHKKNAKVLPTAACILIRRSNASSVKKPRNIPAMRATSMMLIAGHEQVIAK